MKLPHPLELFPSVFSAIFGRGFAVVFGLRQQEKRNLKRVAASIFVLILISGTMAAVYLVQTNQDLRQQAAFFNFGRFGESSQETGPLMINGEIVNAIDLTLADEPFRVNPSIIFANGVPSSRSEKNQVIFTLKQGDATILEEEFNALIVKEFPINPGSYTLEIKAKQDGSILYSTGISPDTNATHVVTRTDDGTATGTFRYTHFFHNAAPFVRVYNLSTDNALTLQGGNLDAVNSPVTIESNTFFDPYFTAPNQTSFQLQSSLSKVNNQIVSIQNDAQQRLYFFIMGDESENQLSLATIPLPPSEVALVNPANGITQIETGNTSFDEYLNNRAPLVDQFAYLNYSYFYTADEIYTLKNKSLGSEYLGTARLKNLGKQTVVWSELPLPPESFDLNKSVFALVGIPAGEEIRWSMDLLKEARLLGWYTPVVTTDGTTKLQSVKVVSNPKPDRGDKVMWAVIRFDGTNPKNDPTIFTYGYPMAATQTEEGYKLEYIN